MRVENDDKRTRTEFKLNLLDLDKQEYAIMPVGFNSCIVLPSADLQKIVRDMAGISERVEIRNIGRELVLKCTGNFCNQETVLQGYDDDDEDDDAPADHDASLIKQGVFPLRYLLMFTKCSSLSSNVEIYLKNMFPLIMKYKLVLGDLKLCLAPLADGN